MTYNPFPKIAKRPGPSQASQFFQQEMNDPGGPTVASRFVNNNPQEGLLSLGSSSPDLSMPEKPESAIKFDEHQAQLAAADDGSTAPLAAKRYVDAYMADPEWKKAHDAEDDIVEKLAPGIGTMILDRLTRGAYSQGRVRQLEAARIQKRDVEKRYFDIQTREDFLEAQRKADDIAQNAMMINNTKANAEWDEKYYGRKAADSKEARDISEHEARLAQAAAATKSSDATTAWTHARAAAERYVNVPANTNLVDTATGGTIARGQDKQFNTGSGRDYSIETETNRADRVSKLYGDYVNMSTYDPRFIGKSREELMQMARDDAAALTERPGAPSANPQYLAPPPGIAKPNPQVRSMFLGGNAAPPPPPLEDPNIKRVRIKMNGGNRS